MEKYHFHKKESKKYNWRIKQMQLTHCLLCGEGCDLSPYCEDMNKIQKEMEE